jgi:hypothetical protein
MRRSGGGSEMGKTQINVRLLRSFKNSEKYLMTMKAGGRNVGRIRFEVSPTEVFINRVDAYSKGKGYGRKMVRKLERDTKSGKFGSGNGFSKRKRDIVLKSYDKSHGFWRKMGYSDYDRDTENKLTSMIKTVKIKGGGRNGQGSKADSRKKR